MSDRPRLRLTPGFAGIEYRQPTAVQLSRAHRETKRTKQDERLSEKLDRLLGSVDDEEEDDH
jgi:hypothetical protein